jgi:hypothetical protein
MSWDVTDKFPSWGESGASPADGFFYEGGDQINEKHLDFLWNSLKTQEDEVQAALTDIDSDKDGTVDEADTVVADAIGISEIDLSITPTWTAEHTFDNGLDVSGNVASGTTVIWNESGGYISQSVLENDSITVAGNIVSLGGSTSINHTNISNISSDDHHTRYTDLEASNAAPVQSVNGNTGDISVDVVNRVYRTGVDGDTLQFDPPIYIADGVFSVTISQVSDASLTMTATFTDGTTRSVSLSGSDETVSTDLSMNTFGYDDTIDQLEVGTGSNRSADFWITGF